MKQFNTYLTFAGNCEEALKFYSNSLGGKVVSMQMFDGAPMPVPENYKKKVLHAEFRADQIYFMASDGMPGQPVSSGDQVALAISLTTEQEQDAVFNKLSAGGKVTMPLQDTFWGARFGMLKDKYGINWMLNFDKPKK